jgi:uncharacterized protein (DUF2235 family)
MPAKCDVGYGGLVHNAAIKRLRSSVGFAGMKRLILCFDGTWNTADNGGSPTNVVRMARMIPPSDSEGVKQVVFYDEGIGTGIKIDKLVGGITGIGLDNHVKDGYRFLSQNYEAGDEIYIYGFSRGAFTARSLGGFIGAGRGVLQRDKARLIELAWKFYRTPPDNRNMQELHNEIEPNVQKVSIKVMGVFDTVGSLGIPTDFANTFNRRNYAFHDTTLSPIIDNAFHALAIDEQRASFAPTLWARPKVGRPSQTVEQVWFPGVHSDVGGGYDNCELSDLALRWMLARSLSNSRLSIDKGSQDYFVPEKSFARTTEDEIAALARAKDRLQQKWKGALHDSLGHFALSRAWPRMRVMGGEKPKRGSGPISTFFRTSDGSNFQESIHWSAMERFRSAKSEDLKKYDPPNLRVVTKDLPELRFDDECKPGVKWFTDDAAPVV